MNSSEGHNFDASVALPLTHQFGLQADGLYSHISGLDFYGGAGHLFWRNPKMGLVGLTGGYLYSKGVDTFQVGAEGQCYVGRFTLGDFAGAGAIDYSSTAPFINSHPTRFVGRVLADYYPVDNLRVGASYTTVFKDNLFKGEIEYQTPINGLALTGEVARGDYGYDHWLVGLRYYFGGKKTLVARHRQDDPPGLMKQILHGLGVYGAEWNRKGNAYAQTHPGTGNWSSYGISTPYRPLSMSPTNIPSGGDGPIKPGGRDFEQP
jgi:hypothetical protein